MLGFCDDPRIIFRNVKFFFVTRQLLRAKLRLAVFYRLQPLITDEHRHKIRIREIAVIVCILLGAHRIGVFFVVIPAACLLNDRLALPKELDLPLAFAVNRAPDRLERVQVLHLGTGTKLFCADLPHGKVDIRTHGTFLQLAVRRTQILNDQAQLFQISDDLLGASHIRLGHDLDQRHAAAVVIHQRTVLPLIVNQLSGILLHMNLMNTNFPRTRGRLDLDKAIVADGQIQLRNLIILRIIRIKIILAVKFAELVNLAVGRQPHRHRVLHDLLIQYRKRPRHTGADRAGVRVRSRAERGRASAEDLGLRRQLYMNLQSNDCLILLRHIIHPPVLLLPLYFVCCLPPKRSGKL